MTRPLGQSSFTRLRPMSLEKKEAHIHYGVIDVVSAPSVVQRPPESIAEAATVVAPVPSDINASFRSHQRLLDAFEVQQAARSVTAPTLDDDVKLRLRELGEPICLFGEGAYERRERLRYLLAKQSFKQGVSHEVVVHVDSSRVERRPRLFFSQGGPALTAARRQIARFSLPRAVKRLKRDRQEFGSADPLEVEGRIANYNRMLGKKLEVLVSQVGSERPLCCGKFAPGDAIISTSSWSPIIRIWKVPTCSAVGQGLHGHKERVNSLTWNPLFQTSLKPTSLSDATHVANIATNETIKEEEVEEGNNGSNADNISTEDDIAFSSGWHLASGSFDTTIGIWNLSMPHQPVALLKGHEERVNRVESHPSGQFLASTSHDETWRLWDINTAKELLVQEGHSTSVYGLRFHPDGSLVFTGDLGGIVRGWDLRTGRTVMTLLGHVKQVLGITINQWRCNQLATASDDNTVRVWDIRKQRCIDTILAHGRLISEVAYEPVRGRFLMTTSYDNSLKVWSSTEYSCSATLLGHEARVMGGDISGDGQCLASVSFDRTFKLWTPTKHLDDGEIRKP